MCVCVCVKDFVRKRQQLSNLQQQQQPMVETRTQRKREWNAQINFILLDEYTCTLRRTGQRFNIFCLSLIYTHRNDNLPRREKREKTNREERDYDAHATKTFSVYKLSCTTKITLMMIMTLLPLLLLFQLLPFASSLAGWIDSLGENLRKYDYCNACTLFVVVALVFVWCVCIFGRAKKRLARHLRDHKKKGSK